MKLKLAAAGLGLASLAGTGVLAGTAAAAAPAAGSAVLADANSPNVSCNSGHGAFGAFSQNPNSPVGYVNNGMGNGAHAPGQDNVGPGFGQTHNDGQTGASNSSYSANCKAST
jgi:hypothetical protein